VLAEIVRLTQKQGLKGAEGGWKDFLQCHEKQFGSGLSDPAKRSKELLVAFLQTFKKEEKKVTAALSFVVFDKMIRRNSDHNAMKQLIEDCPGLESPQQMLPLAAKCRLVRLTMEHPQYTQYYSLPFYNEILSTVADYRTHITGISSKDLEGVTCSLVDIQKSLKKLLSHGTILVGHSLHNDLRGFNSDIDFINMQVVLGFPVRKEGEPHNCMNDAQAAMKLVLAKLEHGYDDPIVTSCCDVRKN
ncbi:hypothetical protein BHE74_00014353, partial [Ensete ventricosum]